MLPFLDKNSSLSIILPVYNGMKYLRQSVESVLSQNYRDFDFHIIDDCSNDGSWQYLQTLQDDRITLYRNPINKGLFFNLNYLIKNSCGALIKLWSQDDVMYPDCIGEIINFHREHPHIGFSYSQRDYVDENGKNIPVNKVDNTPTIISTDLHAKISLFTGSIAGNISNVTLNKTVLEEVGLFDEQMVVSGDFDMWVRLAKDHETGFIKKKLVQLREHEEQLSRQFNSYTAHIKEDLRVYRYLLNYVKPGIKKNGLNILRKKKLVFYYTLMLKAFMKGKFKTGGIFYRELSRFDNFFKISMSFAKEKLLGSGKKTMQSRSKKKS